MSKRRISHQQQSRIKKLQSKHIQHLQNQTTSSSDFAEDPSVGQEGLLVAQYGVYVDIEALDGKIYRCNIRQNLGAIVAGDKVVWQATGNDTGILLAILPRRSSISRAIGPHKTKLLAANLDQVIVVFAPQPRPAISAIDSYLVAIEAVDLQPVILCNKADLLTEEDNREFSELLKIYSAIGYSTLFTSVNNSRGIDELETLLKDHTSIFVGQSGVGKSSLINHLLPHHELSVADFSGHGVHTTTTSRLYHLPTGGDLIDSPGVRDFVLWDLPVEKISWGFKEFRPYLGRCHFRDCSHNAEKDCALVAACEDGKISRLRLDSYHRIIKDLNR